MKIVIVGAGEVGSHLARMLSGTGHDITVVDVIDKRLDKARELGAGRVIRGDREDAVKAVMEATGGQGVPLVFECAGSPVTTLQAGKVVGANGVVVLVGMAANPELKMDIGTISAREARIETIFRYRNLYPTAIRAVESGAIPLAKIASHLIPFEKMIEGMYHNMDHKDEVIKGVVTFV